MTSPDIITSRRHALVEELRGIRDARTSNFLFLEGPRLVQEAVLSGLKIDTLILTPAAMESESKVSGVPARRTFQVADTVFEAISDVKTPQGILAIARRPLWDWKDLFLKAPAPILILDGVQDPGNLATIVRTAEAAGAAGLVTTPGTARLYSPKALRGAMGSSLRIPCVEHRQAEDITNHLHQASYTFFAASMDSAHKTTVLFTSINWKKPVALLLGQEGSGFSPDWTPLVDSWLHIPMRPPVESLNVAAAAAVLLYESLRQRGN